MNSMSIGVNNSSLTVNDNQFYFDYQDGKYGFNTDPNRGADTFSPFSSGKMEILLNSSNNTNITYTFNKNCDSVVICMQGTTDAWTRTLNGVSFGTDVSASVGGNYGMSSSILHNIKASDIIQLNCSLKVGFARAIIYG